MNRNHNAADTAVPFGEFRELGVAREVGPEGLLNFLETRRIRVPAELLLTRLGGTSESAWNMNIALGRGREKPMEDVLTSYRDQVVVVTGSASGIGAATSRILSAAGARVIGIDRRALEAESLDFIETDLGEATSIHAALRRVPAEVWALFNSAGLSGGAADPRTVLRVNFIGTREFTELIADRIPRGGAIASVSSASAKKYRENIRETMDLVETTSFMEGLEWLAANEEYVDTRGGYTIAKEALVVYTAIRCMGFGSRGIRLNCIAPGVTDTPMLLDSVKLHGQGLLTRIPQPLGRMATADEQARILLFLNSSWADYVNGATIWSDGGQITSSVIAV